jgi:hypothetical protein
MTAELTALAEFEAWYQGLPTQKGGFPARGTVGAALVVLERLKEDFDLRLQAHRAPGGQAQISGVSGAAVARILKNFGEERPFLKEGGRTNRGGPGAIKAMLEHLRKAQLENLSAEDRNAVLERLQAFLVEKVREFHGRQRLKVTYDPSKTARQSVQDLLALASETGKAGAVAQHLVGAKLQLRYPEVAVENRSFSTADEQLGRAGDYLVGDTAFHVTVAPMPAVYEKCKANLAQGLRVFLLVPEKSVVGARQNADAIAPNRIAVESIESFVGQNLEELSEFSQEKLAQGFRRLLDTYNGRVNEVEIDKSLLIEIPANLLRDGEQ